MRSPKVRFALAGVLVLLFLVAAFWLRQNGSVLALDEWRRASGPWVPLLFTFVFGLLTLFFVPRPALAAAAGALFSLPVALPVVVAGTVLGAAAAFGLARALGREPLAPLLRRSRIQQLDSFLVRRGFVATVVCRLVPVVPFAAVNYAAGITGVRTLPFLAGTAVGTVPANLSYVMFGGALVADAGTGLWLALALGGVVLIGLVLARAARKHLPAFQRGERHSCR
ncbi:VTT domain-containing protein [Saccharopolyspora sp. WRP15-2]|uniref:TVP38/TMEM64 family membrane protein n=1 Tax=Saccharopolyspora oryzae TaxID=2997343 RepID=A0ABT4UQP3_9PSEU|nr:VTT domain-containing protein [Saccharopolyspora oryzae]MDA3624040.1 VTT domain-containing protein [Saccharopolyspora oryzae]